MGYVVYNTGINRKRSIFKYMDQSRISLASPGSVWPVQDQFVFQFCISLVYPSVYLRCSKITWDGIGLSACPDYLLGF